MKLGQAVAVGLLDPDPIQESDSRWPNTSGPIAPVLHEACGDCGSNWVDRGWASVGWGLFRGSWTSCPSMREVGGDSCGSVTGGPIVQWPLVVSRHPCAGGPWMEFFSD